MEEKNNVILEVRDLKVYFETIFGDAKSVDGISFDRANALKPEALALFLVEWKKVSKDANLNHIEQVESPALDQFSVFGESFIDAQIEIQERKLRACLPFLTDDERDNVLPKAIKTYREYIVSYMDAMTTRVKVATPAPVKATTKAKAKVKAKA